MNTAWSDEDSEDNQNDEKDLLGNVAFVGYLSNIVLTYIKRQIMLQQKLFIVITIQS